MISTILLIQSSLNITNFKGPRKKFVISKIEHFVSFDNITVTSEHQLTETKDRIPGTRYINQKPREQTIYICEKYSVILLYFLFDFRGSHLQLL